jgi:hypothetical protein
LASANTLPLSSKFSETSCPSAYHPWRARHFRGVNSALRHGRVDYRGIAPLLVLLIMSILKFKQQFGSHN